MKSKLGLIPSDWDVTTLGNLGKLTSGTTPSRAKQSLYFENGNIRWVKTTDLNNGVVRQTEESVTEKALNDTSLKVLPKQTLLVAMYGGFRQIGRTGLLGIEATVNQALTAVLFTRKDVLPLYVLYWMNLKVGIWRRFAASSRKDPNITKNDVKSFPFLKPPLPEQQKIAAILSTWDRAIDLTRQLLQEKEAQKKGLMQRLLTGKVRVKGFEGEWKEVQLGEIFSPIGKSNDGLDHTVMTISARQGLVSQKKKFDRVIAGNSLSKYTLLKRGDLAYNKGNSKLYQMGCIYQLEDHDSALVPFVYICFSPTDGIDSNFYKHWFLAHGLDRQLKKIITSGARGDGLLNVSKKDFFKLKAPLPTKKEQTQIGKILSTMDDEIQLLKKKQAAIKAQKKGLMQRLLTGKIRVNP